VFIAGPRMRGCCLVACVRALKDFPLRIALSCVSIAGPRLRACCLVACVRALKDLPVHIFNPACTFLVQGCVRAAL